MKTLKGPGIFLAQFMADDAPFNSIDAMAEWAAKLGFTGVQVPIGNANFIDSTITRAIWTQDWTGLISTTANYGVGDHDYEGTNRSDDVSNYGISLDYKFRRWLSIGVAYDFDDRDSNINALDFERNSYSLNVSLSL